MGDIFGTMAPGMSDWRRRQLVQDELARAQMRTVAGSLTTRARQAEERAGGTLEPYDPSLSERAAGGIADVLEWFGVPGRTANDYGERLTGLGETLFDVPAIASAADELSRSTRRGDWRDVAGAGLGLGMALVPGSKMGRQIAREGRVTRAELGAVTKADPFESAVGIGRYAGESIPARSAARDFTPLERAQINRIGAETGCHTCGTTDPGTIFGDFILDHQRASALNQSGEPQRLFPHCLACSRKQGLAIATYLRQRAR
jgi:hypothetical protein